MLITLNIEGMHCTGCQNRIQNALSNQPTIKNLQVSLENHQATFELTDEGSLDSIVELLTDLGFTVTDIQKGS